MKRTLAILLAALMALTALPALASGAENGEVTTLQIYGLNTSYDSLDGYINDYLSEKIGVRLDIVYGDAEKTQALFASGDLPDVGVYATNGTLLQAINGNLLTDLDPYLEQLPNVTKNFPFVTDFIRTVYCDGRGLYGLPANSGTLDANYTFAITPSANTINIKWDVYEKIGAPKVASLNELIPVLKQMMDAQPELSDGAKTWGLGLSVGWAEGSEFEIPNVMPLVAQGYDETLVGLNEINEITHELGKDILNQESKFMEGVRFYYDCNQAGILDPDSVYQYYGAAQAKVDNGQYMMAGWAQWYDSYNNAHAQDAEPSGYLPLYESWITPCVNSATGRAFGTTPYSISATTKNLDACLRFLNLLYSFEDARNLLYGPEGLYWEFGEDGKCHATAANDERQKTGVAMDAEGKTMNLANWAFGMDYKAIDPATNEPLDMSCWSSVTDQKLKSNPMMVAWGDHYGYKSPTEAFKAGNGFGYATKSRNISFIPAMDEDTTMIYKAVTAAIRTSTWKMIFAKDEAEFNALYEELIPTVQGLGYDTLTQWGKDMWKQSQDQLMEFDK